MSHNDQSNYDKYLPSENPLEDECTVRVNKHKDVDDKEMAELMRLCDDLRKKLRIYSRGTSSEDTGNT